MQSSGQIWPRVRLGKCWRKQPKSMSTDTAQSQKQSLGSKCPKPRLMWQAAIYIYIYIYMFLFCLCFRQISGHNWAQERAQRPRLEKCCINQRKLTHLRKGNQKYNLYFEFLDGLRPNLAPRPVPTGRARKTKQSTPKISPGDQF